MPLSVSETSLVSNVSPVCLENSEIVLKDDLGDSSLLDIEEYRCTNRELVNLENAAVNIDNSNDVIIGPVTQFNVSGNVTIYQNGREQPEAINGTVINQEQPFNEKPTDDAKLGRFGKTESEDQDLKQLHKQSKFIKLALSISFALLILVGVTFAAIYFSQDSDEGSKFGSDPADDKYIGKHQVLDRTKWNGRPPLSYRNITSAVPMVIIKHTGGGPCFTFQVCAGKLQTIQSQAVSRGAPDIYYSFLIAGDENIYVGRGWDVHPQQRDDVIDIAFMGSYAYDKLTPGMIDAALELLKDGVQNSKLTKDYKIVCHNQTEATESPGFNVYNEVRKWPHYDSGLYFSHRHLNGTTRRTT